MFDIGYTSVSSFVLLASSLTMVLALAAAQKRDFMRMRLWLLATAMLGLTFVGGQVYEFTAFYREGLAINTNLFGTTFFVLTGFHGVARHGRDPDAAVAHRACRSRTGCPTTRRSPWRWSGLYWHFVDIVWIIIFTVVYLIPTNPGGS